MRALKVESVVHNGLPTFKGDSGQIKFELCIMPLGSESAVRILVVVPVLDNLSHSKGRPRSSICLTNIRLVGRMCWSPLSQSFLLGIPEARSFRRGLSIQMQYPNSRAVVIFSLHRSNLFDVGDESRYVCIV